MFIANTTGTSSADRIEGMIKNTIYGIISCKGVWSGASDSGNPECGWCTPDGDGIKRT